MFLLKEQFARPVHEDEEPDILERIRRGERIEHYETVRQRKDGSRVEISLTVSPIKNAQADRACGWLAAPTLVQLLPPKSGLLFLMIVGLETTPHFAALNRVPKPHGWFDRNHSVAISSQKFTQHY